MQSRVTIDTDLRVLLLSFSLMGLGMGLTMSPMTTAAMNAVAPTRPASRPGSSR